MELVWYFLLIIFVSFFERTELKPIDQSVILKLPITIENGMNIILEGKLYSEHDQLSLTFSGENMSEQDEWHVTYIPEKRNIYLINNGNEAVIFSPKLHPERFVIQFSARTIEDKDQHLMELYYEETENVRQPSGEFIDLPSFKLVDHINVKGFPNVHNVTFSFNR